MNKTAIQRKPIELTYKLLRYLIPCAIGLIFLAWIGIPMIYCFLWSMVDPEYPWSYPAVLPEKLSFFHWRYIIENTRILDSVITSFLIAGSTTLLSFLIALPTAYTLGRRKLKGAAIYKTIMLLPLVLPGMAMAIFLGRMIFMLHLSGTYIGVILAHTLMGVPYMMRILVVNFESVPQDLVDASSNLGAGAVTRFFEVYLPMIMPGLIAGAIFTFINSMEEFNLTFIIGLPMVKTIPTVLFSYLGEYFIRTRASVVSLILLIPNLTLLLITERFIKTEYMSAALGKM
ncbi:ABC transporter, permease protein [Treponema primitia ZAS-2]|uniref:ABC transporter, permease protein n=1 Tax=Treponema primitia (strain ATCC BAA-887 / DSM 12427 / ZAS-2) TaxID=545694 RepID=F5YNA8_TREPZ|nr:ABC transporter permease [Treponema primitia]AEF84228.1 ABC transporter, permease protein [Treponema primitia ZAS-2]